MFSKILSKIFGSKQERDIKKLQPVVDEINSLESSVKRLTDKQLRAKTDEFIERLKSGETLDDLMTEAFAVVRETARRTIGERPFDVQLMGAIVLHRGDVIEMKTGEGKTLTSTMPVYLNALEGEGAHLATVNEYLAKRDAEWMGEIYKFLGLSVGVTLSRHEVTIEMKREAYQADITYGVASEFGFDYLNDNLAVSLEQKVQRGHHYVIVDEVDSVLIDESRTPLIISDRRDEPVETYQKINRMIPHLREEVHYKIDEKSSKRGNVNLTEEGVEKIEQLLKVDNVYDPNNMELVHHVNQALIAHTLYERDVDYVIEDGQVIIVDAFTGRLQPGRRWSDGLHQAVEAKERVKVVEETQTTASISYQNYFRMYDKLSGMTGTAETEATEFAEIYDIDVVVIPTNEPMIREDHSDLIYKTEEGKYKAAIEEIKEAHERGQPVLVGTTHSIEKTERISKLLKRERLKHQVLNAKQHAREAKIIAQAGMPGAITVATNMAGRGVDIKLGGNPEIVAENILRKKSTDSPEIDKESKEWKEAIEEAKKICAENKKKVIELGGLRIVGTERHDARRIDNQLRGRSGRQGEPGASRFYLALEDDLMVKFGSNKLSGLMDKVGMDDNTPIEHSWVSKSIEKAQKKMEQHHFETRKQLLKYDDVMNTQREVIYEQRDMVLEGENLKDEILAMLDDVVDYNIQTHLPEGVPKEEWDVEGFVDGIKNTYTVDISKWNPMIDKMARSEIKEKLLPELHEAYETREKELGTEIMRELERLVMLDRIDSHWMDHLYNIDYLQEGIGLRGYGGKDPVVVFTQEASDMFDGMVQRIKEEVTEYIFKAELRVEMPEQLRGRRKSLRSPTSQEVHRSPFESAPTAQSSEQRAKKAAGIKGTKGIKSKKEVGRNDPCPCGSGKKYKYCCGR